MNPLTPENKHSIGNCRKYQESLGYPHQSRSVKRRRCELLDYRPFHEMEIDTFGNEEISLSRAASAALSSDSSQSANPEHRELKALFLCDIECHDENGAGYQTIRDALKMGIPFFCSKAMLHGTFLRHPHWGTEEWRILNATKTEINMHLQRKPSSWDIWEENGGRELLFFAPRHAEDMSSPSQKLRAWGLDENKLTRINADQALEGHRSPLTLNSFLSLFPKNPEARVRIALTAHSSTEMIGGMTKNDFLKFLTFFNENRKCSGLFLTTCFSGGANTLCYKDLDLNFPVIVRSIGEFVSYYTGTKSTLQFVSEPEKILSQPVVETAKAYESTLGEECSSMWQNLPQIKLPGKRKFIPLYENRSLHLVKNRNGSASQEVIWGAKIVQLSSRHIMQPLQISTLNPLLLSIKPAHSTHVIDRVGHNGSLKTLLQQTIDTMRQKHPGTSRQILFIKNLHTSDAVLKNVYLSCGPGEVKLLAYDEKQDQYLEYPFQGVSELDKIQPQVISKDKFSLFIYQWTKQHVESSHKKNWDVLVHIVEALKECKGGISEHLQLYLDCTANRSIPLTLRPKVRHLAKEQNIELLYLMWTALYNHEHELFQLLIEGAKSELNTPLFDGTTLLHLAVQAQNPEAVALLLEENANVNQQELTQGLTPLHMCVKMPVSYRRDLILDMLLSANDLDTEKLDKHSRTPLCHVSNKYDADRLLRAGAIPEHSYDTSPLRFAIYGKNTSLVEYFLSKGFLDRSSCRNAYLKDAIRSGDIDIVEMLLAHGADPTKNIDSGLSAFEWCALYGTPEILERLAAHADESVPRNAIFQRLSAASSKALSVGNCAIYGKSLFLITSMQQTNRATSKRKKQRF